MSKTKDMTGQVIGKLKLLERKREIDEKGRGRTYYLCECECGDKSWVRADSLSRRVNPTRSCGCLAEKTQFKVIDIINKRFSRLVVLEPTEKKANLMVLLFGSVNAIVVI
jgi:hypothetical protein